MSGIGCHNTHGSNELPTIADREQQEACTGQELVRETGCILDTSVHLLRTIGSWSHTATVPRLCLMRLRYPGLSHRVLR